MLVPSVPAEASVLPSGDHEMPRTCPVCDARILCGMPFSASQTWMVVPLPLARRLPEGDQERPHLGPPLPGICRMASPVFVSQICTVPSREAEASWELPGPHASPVMRFECSPSRVSSSVPAGTSQIFTLPSAPPIASRVPLGAHERLVISISGNIRVGSRLVAASQI